MNLKIKVVKAPDIYAIQRRMLDKIADAWDKWGKQVIEKELGMGVNNWRDRPGFYHAVSVKPGKWMYAQLHQASTEGGKHYNWVRLGTGLHGPRRAAYPIYPKTPGGVLRFTTPHSPKTRAPRQAIAGGPTQVVFTTRVDKPGQTHPGIEPRNEAKHFPGWVFKEYVKATGRGFSLLNVTHVAARSAFKSR